MRPVSPQIETPVKQKTMNIHLKFQCKEVKYKAQHASVTVYRKMSTCGSNRKILKI